MLFCWGHVQLSTVAVLWYQFVISWYLIITIFMFHDGTTMIHAWSVFFFCAHIALFCVNLVNFHWQKQIKPYFGVVVDGVEILITMFTRIKASRGILQFFCP